MYQHLVPVSETLYKVGASAVKFGKPTETPFSPHRGWFEGIIKQTVYCRLKCQHKTSV